MSSAYGATVNVPKPIKDLTTILPIHSTLKTGLPVVIQAVNHQDEAQLTQLHAMLNHEIRSGDTYPQEYEMNVDEWGKYFLSAEAYVVTEVDGKEVLGTFYIKPNFPGRCSHICNGGFIVNHAKRNLGVGRLMAQSFIQLAPALGYKAAMFNLVFVSNVASVKLWQSMGFQQIGRIPRAGRLNIHDASTNSTKEEFVDAIMFYKSFDDAAV